MHYGKALMKALDEKRMSQAALARKINVCQTTISSMIHSKHEPTIGLYARVLKGAGYDLCLCDSKTGEVVCDIETDFAPWTKSNSTDPEKAESEK